MFAAYFLDDKIFYTDLSVYYIKASESQRNVWEFSDAFASFNDVMRVWWNSYGEIYPVNRARDGGTHCRTGVPFYDQIIRDIRYIHLYHVSHASLFLALSRRIYTTWNRLTVFAYHRKYNECITIRTHVRVITRRERCERKEKKENGSQAAFAEITGGRLGERRDKPHTTHGVCICSGLAVRYSLARRANRELLLGFATRSGSRTRRN